MIVTTTTNTNDTTTFSTPVVVTPIKEDTESTNENATHASNRIDEDLEDHNSHPKNEATITTFGVSTDHADDTSEGLPVSVASSTTTNTSSSSSSTAAALPPDNDSTPTPTAVLEISETTAATPTSMTPVIDNTIAPIESRLQQVIVDDVQTPATTTTTAAVSSTATTTTKKRPATLSSNSRNRSSSVSSNTTGDASTSHKSSYNYSPPSKHVKQHHEDDAAATNATTTAEEVVGKASSPATTVSKPAPAPAQKQQQTPKPASSYSSPSAVAKNWKQQSSVQAAELAALKQRGLAKLLNQHFTTTAQQLAIEKAAADAAILDLQERKARTSTFTPTNNSSEISPLDQACIQANKWRAECRRKERETLLLYQQYVHKFGPTTILPVPTVTATTTTTTSSHRVVPTAPKIPPTAPSRPTPKEEGVERPVPTLVPSMTAQIEQTLDEYCARGAVAHPSIMTHGIDQTYSSIATKEEVAFREYYRKQLESKGADVICSPGYYKGNGTAIDAYTPTPDHDNNDIDDPWNNNNNDVCSMVSGLTTLHSALTREFLYDCEQSVATFLRDEQATVQKMLEDEEGDVSSSGDTHVSNVLVVQDSDATAKAAENMVQQMQDILQEYQKKHFGTGTVTETTVGPNDIKDNNKTYPHPYPTDNLNETWMVYYDELYRQEYYHETHTNRTQWDPPGGKMKNLHDTDPSSSYSHSTDVYSVMNGSTGSDLLYEDYDYDERMDRILESNPNRVMAYRKRQRRKRRRRRIITTIIVTLTILLVGSGSYYLHCHSMNPSITGNSFDHPSSPKPAVCSAIDNHVMEQWNYLTHLISEDHPIIHEQVDLETSLESSQPPNQCMLQLEDEIYIRYYLQSTTSPLDASNDEMIRRPWGCNIPLAYLFHAKCRRMATLRPIFDLQALINSMLQ